MNLFIYLIIQIDFFSWIYFVNKYIYMYLLYSYSIHTPLSFQYANKNGIQILSVFGYLIFIYILFGNEMLLKWLFIHVILIYS